MRLSIKRLKKFQANIWLVNDSESVKRVLKEGVLSGGHGDAIRQTYNTVGELLNLWRGVRGGDGKYTEVSDKITGALHNVITTIEQVDRDALDGDEESGFSPYGLRHLSR